MNMKMTKRSRSKGRGRSKMHAVAAAGLLVMGGAAMQPAASKTTQEFQAVEGDKIVFRIEKPVLLYNNFPFPGAVRYSIRIDAGTGASVAGKATAGKDYRAPRGKLMFGIGKKFGTFKVATHTDDIKEGRETFKVYLLDPEWIAGYRAGEGKTRHQRQSIWERTRKFPQRIVLTGVIVDR